MSTHKYTYICENHTHYTLYSEYEDLCSIFMDDLLGFLDWEGRLLQGTRFVHSRRRTGVRCHWRAGCPHCHLELLIPVSVSEAQRFLACSRARSAALVSLRAWPEVCCLLAASRSASAFLTRLARSSSGSGLVNKPTHITPFRGFGSRKRDDGCFSRRDDGTRTRGFLPGGETLYQLSYAPLDYFAPEVGLEPTTFGLISPRLYRLSYSGKGVDCTRILTSLPPGQLV